MSQIEVDCNEQEVKLDNQDNEEIQSIHEEYNSGEVEILHAEEGDTEGVDEEGATDDADSEEGNNDDDVSISDANV